MPKQPKVAMGGGHPPFGIVVWDDAHGDALDDVTLKSVQHDHVPLIMTTVGWLLLENEKGVSIASERYAYDGEERYRGRSFIPRALIRSVTPMKLTSPRVKKEAASGNTGKAGSDSGVGGGDSSGPTSGPAGGDGAGTH